jgi:acylphosphatase
VSTKRIRLRIEGKVQGVFFRESTRVEASRLGLSGWVRNEADGSVAAVAEGEASALDAFVRWCHQGPPLAMVSRVTVAPELGDERFDGFTVRKVTRT